jgi:hypothetical protein
VIQTKVKFGELYMNLILHSPQAANMPEASKAQMQRVMNLPAIQFVFIGAALVGIIVSILFVTVLYFGLFSLVGREGGFKAFLSVTAFAFVPIVLSQMAGILRAFVVPSSLLMFDELFSLSAGAFLDRDSVSPVLFTAASAIDLSSIWTLCLLVIGYGFVARKSLSKVTRTAMVLAPYLAYECIRLLGAALTAPR